MPLKTLRVRRKGTAMVPHYESNVRKFVGWKHDPTQGDDWVNPMTGQPVMDHATGKTKKHGAFVGHDDVVEVPDTVEYRRHLRDGDILPADAETAQACGLSFTPAASAVEEH